MGLTFEWDEKKAERNKLKHFVSFEEASTAFGDPFSITIEDLDHNEKENRLILIGRSDMGRALIVVHIEIAEDAVRIISARKANRKERKYYEE